DLPGTDAWQVRQAFVGRDLDTRLGAMRKLLGSAKDPLQKEAMRALVARAASMVQPDAKLAKDAPELISAMLAAGYDQAAARWLPGTVLVLTGTGFQTARFDQLPAAHMYHVITALQRTGQDFTARMIAAEALSRT